MKKMMTGVMCLVMSLLLCSCGDDEPKENVDDGSVTAKTTWADLVKKYPFLSAFPTFDGEIENCQYSQLSSLESVVFFDYDCESSVADTYCAKFTSDGGWKQSGDDWIYRYTSDEGVYTFSGSFGGGSFGLSFSFDKD